MTTKLPATGGTVDPHSSRFTSTTTPTRRRSALALLSAGGLLLAGCGVIPGIGGGAQAREVAVQALWVDPGSGAAAVQEGVLPATVTVTIGPPAGGLELDVKSQAEHGAGPAWTASSWSAAVAAVLATGTDPRRLKLSYDVSGSIDGPSAGGLLTVATTAAINNKALRSDATMTGTIAPDGSIGPVSGVPNKLVAAQAAGFKVVAIPASLTQAKDLRTNQMVNTVALGRSLGIRVVPVASVQHAYAELVGPWPYQDAAKVPPIDPSVADFLKQRAADYQTKVAVFTKQLGAAPKLIGKDRHLYRDMGKSSAAAAAAGPESVVSYYGAAAGAFESMSYLMGRLKARKDLQSSQLAAITTTTRESIDQLERTLTAQANTGASTAPVWLEQLTAQADSTAWIGPGLTSLFSARKTLDTLSSSPQPEQESLVEVAGTIEATRAWGTFGADGSKVASMIGRLPVPPGADDQLSAWTKFLKDAGDSAVNYLASMRADGSVEKLEADRNSSYGLDTALGYRDALNRPWPGMTPAASAQLNYSSAMSYYVYGTLLVTGVSALGADGDVLEIGDSSTELKNVTAIADVSQQSANYGMQSLSARGADVSYVQWNTSWGHLQAEGLLGVTDADHRALGLTYMWYMNVAIPITLQLASGAGE